MRFAVVVVMAIRGGGGNASLGQTFVLFWGVYHAVSTVPAIFL
jgi:hypothetical protein